MAKTDLSAVLEAAEKSGLVGSDYLKIKDGKNRMRLVDGPLPHPGKYQGRPTFRMLWYAIDRKDGQIKPFFMPYSVFKLLAALQTSEDFAFESIPMPYDVILTAKGAGTKEVEYSLLPTRKELGSEELLALVEKKPLKDVQDAMRAKEANREAEFAPQGTFDPDAVPDDGIPL
jgi:hypothetical protein